MLVDVHSHLNHEYFHDKLDEVIKRAKNAGVKRIVISGVNPSSNKKILEIKKKYPDIVRCTAGIYPIDALGLAPDASGLERQTEPIDLDQQFEWIKQNKKDFIGIGEVGLDFHWDKENHEKQIENFKRIIEFAIKIKKPLIIHSRKAEQECFDILNEYKKSNKNLKISFHSYQGSKKLLQKIADSGMYFSIPPNIVKLPQSQQIAEIVSMNRILTETDAPWLSPYSDKKNEPAFVVETIKKIAEIKKLTEKEVMNNIWINYVDFFDDA